MRGKQAVERAFSGIQSLLLEMLLGWRGIDTADRGEDPETDAVLTVAQAEHLIATWAVKIWQNRELGEYAPAWDPGTRHSQIERASCRERVEISVVAVSL